MVTRKQVADAAGVSEATVSRVFNHVGPMKESTRTKVLQVAEQLNYHPHAIAQNFARRRSGNLGVVLPYVPKVHLFSTFYFSEILSGIGEEVRNQGYDMLLYFISPQELINYVKPFRSQKIDACVILGAQNTEAHRHAFLLLQEHGYPFCLIDQWFDGLTFNVVSADHEQGSYAATKYFIAKGFRKIAFLNGSPFFSNSLDRQKGYLTAMEHAELTPLLHLKLEGNYSRKSGYLLAQKVWEHRDEIEAILVGNDRMAIGLLQGLREISDDAVNRFAIIGCDDSDIARLHHPPLSSIYVPFFEMGRVATRQVIHQFQNPSEPPSQIKLMTQLTIRELTALKIIE